MKVVDEEKNTFTVYPFLGADEENYYLHAQIYVDLNLRKFWLLEVADALQESDIDTIKEALDEVSRLLGGSGVAPHSTKATDGGAASGGVGG